jgi:hypothetical protein
MGDTRLEPLVLTQAERRTLESWAKRRKTAQGEGAENLYHLGKALRSAVERSVCAGPVLARPEVG